MTGCLSVYVTIADRAQAEALGTVLVEERLAACANVIDGITSIYRWQGALQTGREAAVLLKTRATLFPRLEARIRALHSDAVPCIVAWPIAQASAAYLAWLQEATADSGSGA